MQIWYRIKQMVDQNSLLRRAYDLLKLILRIVPYYLVEEGLFDNKDKDLKPKLNKYAVGFLGPS